MHNLSFYDCLSDEGKQVVMEQFTSTTINNAIELVKKLVSSARSLNLRY